MSEFQQEHRYSAFEGHRLLVSGRLDDVRPVVREAIAQGAAEAVLVFDDIDGRQIDLDWQSPAAAAPPAAVQADSGPAAAQPAPAPRGRGRPRLGVVAREVTLLPRHWEWLSSQPGGASVALRKLVDEARRRNQARDQIRQAREAAFRFMSALAGNETGFEEASRALFAGDAARFAACLETWPADVRAHALRLAGAAFDDREAEADA